MPSSPAASTHLSSLFLQIHSPMISLISGSTTFSKLAGLMPWEDRAGSLSADGCRSSLSLSYVLTSHKGGPTGPEGITSGRKATKDSASTTCHTSLNLGVCTHWL